MRVLAIGDIHGCKTALQTLAAAVTFMPTDTVITLGDYVDRGPDSKGVIDFLIGLKSRTNLICLRGNHEVMMLEAKQEPGILSVWQDCGGAETLASYGPGGIADVPAAHWEFLDATQRYYELEKDFFVHANVEPDRPLAEQPDEILFWEHIHSPPPHVSGKRMICGHTRQKDGDPLDLGHVVCIDTSVYRKGWLTCLEVRTGIIWQANQDGDIRRGLLG